MDVVVIVIMFLYYVSIGRQCMCISQCCFVHCHSLLWVRGVNGGSPVSDVNLAVDLA